MLFLNGVFSSPTLYILELNYPYYILTVKMWDYVPSKQLFSFQLYFLTFIFCESMCLYYYLCL